MNRKAFTLVELLVTIVILGIITGISIPLIRNIRETQQRKQYETYRNSLSYASKVYADSFSEDLFGHNEIDCATVSYNQLKAKSLIKDIPIDGVSCASNDTYVKIVKFEDQYSYLPKITCGKPQTEGIVSKDVEIPEGNVDSDLCGHKTETNIGIKFTPESSYTPNVQRKNITVEFKSPTGIHSDPIIYWDFVRRDDYAELKNIVWKKLDINVPSKKKQKELILQGNTIKITKEFITPKNATDEYYLVLKIDRLQDLGGSNWTKTDTEMVSGGYYAVDNEPPNLNGSDVEFSKPRHRQVTPTLKFKAIDRLSPENKLRMCISEDTVEDECSKNISDIRKKQNGWVTYEKNKVLPVINNATNEKNHNIFVSIGDQAGNYVTKQVVYYHSPVDYSITYNLDKGTHGTNHPSPVDFDEEFIVDYPTKMITLTFENKDSKATVDYTSSTIKKSGASVNYTFNGWNISGMDKSNHILGSMRSNKKEEKNVKETKFMGLRNTTGGVIFDATWKPPQITLPKITKIGYTCVWKSNGIDDKKSGGKYTPSAEGGATARTFTSSCTANTFTVAYNANGGNGTTSSQDCTYDADCKLKSSNFTKTGYTFSGWKKDNKGEILKAGNSIKNEATGGKITYYAQWNVNSYTISYNYNKGNEPSSGVPSSYTYGTGATINGKPTRSGYKFAGWNIENKLAGSKFTQSIGTTATGDKTYYAEWCQNCASVSNGKCTLTANAGSCSYATSCDTGYDLTSGASTRSPTCTIKSFKVTYDKNGGSGTMAKTSCNYNIECNLSKNSFKKDNHKFAGWYTAKTGGTKKTSVKITSDTTVYAHWTANTYTISYNYNKGNEPSSGVPSSYTYGTGATINGKPTRSGYKFAGWNIENKLAGSKFTQSIGTTATGDKTYYAEWCQNCASVSNGKCTLTANAGSCSYTTSCNEGYDLTSGKNTRNPTCTIKSFKVTYNANGGSGTMSQTTCKYNTDCTLSTNKYTKSGYGFAGWYTAANGGTKVTKVNIKKNTTVYAHWGKLPTCSISVTSPSKAVFNGWYKANVSLKLDTANATTYGIGESKGLKNKSTTFTATKEGSITYYGYVENSYGSNNCSIVVKIDKSPPEVVSYLNYYESGGKISCDDTGRRHLVLYNPETTSAEYYDAVWLLWQDKNSGMPDNTDKDKQNAYFNWTRKARDGKWQPIDDSLKNTPSGIYDSRYNQNHQRGSNNKAYDILWFNMNNSPSLKKLKISYHLCDAVGNCVDSSVNYNIVYYKLTYNDNGGSGCSDKVKYTGIRCNEKWGTLCTPKKKNKTFNGWYTKKTGGTKVTSSTVPTSSTTVYAHWK